MSKREYQSNYVPALREPAQPKTVIIDPSDLAILPTSAMTTVEIRTSHSDRAKAFQIVSVPLAAAVGAGSLIVGMVGWSVPIFSVAALAWLWGGFLLTWLAAWVIHNIVSTDGIALIHTLMGWQYLRREQKARLKRYDQ
jgi:small neutral amino acid transporter SnatA (MarC family)